MNDKKMIMVADDEEQIRMLLKQLLEANNYKVVTASDGGEVLDLIEHKHIVPDLLILDIMMPEKTGYEVCEILRNNYLYSTVPILMLTALSTPESMIKGLSIGADDYITKPFDLDNLLERVRNIIDRGNISRKLSTVIDNYKKARDKVAKNDEIYKRLMKIPILPNIFETLKKNYKEEFFITFVNTEEIIKYKDIYSWQVINEFLENLATCGEERIKAQFGNDILFIKKIFASDFLIFFKSTLQIQDISKSVSDILRKNCFKPIDKFIKLPFTCIVKTIKIEYSEDKEFETALFMALYDVLKKQSDSHEKITEDYYNKLLFNDVEYRNVNITNNKGEVWGYFTEIKVEGIGITDLYSIFDEKQLMKIYENIFNNIATKYDKDVEIVLPIPAKIIDSEFLLFLMKYKHLTNIHLALSDINLWDKLFFIKEYLEKIKDIGFKLSLFNYGTYTSNIDTIFTVKPEFVFLHSFIFLSFEKNYIKQEIVKSILQLEDKLGIKIVAFTKFKDKLKDFKINYFWED